MYLWGISGEGFWDHDECATLPWGRVPDWVKWGESQWVLTFPFTLLLSCGDMSRQCITLLLPQHGCPISVMLQRTAAPQTRSNHALLSIWLQGWKKCLAHIFKELFMHLEPWPEMYSEKRLGFLSDLAKGLYLWLGCHINRLCRQGPVPLLLVSNYSSSMIFLFFYCKPLLLFLFFVKLAHDTITAGYFSVAWGF